VSESYDVVVLGTGAAGLSAALTARALGATVGVFEKAATVGGTTAVSGGVAWVPAHNRADVPDPPTVEEAMAYLLAQSNGTIDEERVEAYVRGAEPTIEFIEEHSAVRFTVAAGFPDYRPELPGGRPQGGRSFNPSPKDFGELGEWADRVTGFPKDWSNVGFDAETRARMWGDAGFDPGKDIRVCGQALVGGLLQALLDLGVEPQTESRGVELLTDGERIAGVVLERPEGTVEVEAKLGVVLATGGFEWDHELVKAFLRGPMNGPISPPNNVGDGLRMAMRAGAALGNMREAWWTQVVQLPGDVFEGRPRSRSVRLERSRPRSIIVNRDGRRFGNEATDYNSLGGAFHEFDPNRFDYPNTPAWMVFDQGHLDSYDFLGVEPGGEAPAWFNRSDSVAELAAKTGIDAAALEGTLARWNENVAAERDPDFHRGESAYDGYWGDPSKPTRATKTLGPIDTAPFYAVSIDIGCTGTKGGPMTDVDAQVLDLDGNPIAGLYAAGNTMAGVTGMAYGGAGGTIGPALVFGHRAAAHAVKATAGVGR
jgi:succinate dehydrogenase/fumarate reductase flavoprotein subunit